MASLLFPDAGSRWATDATGAPAVGRTFTAFQAASGSTLATIYADSGGSPGAAISGSTLTTDAYGYLPLFWGPTDGTDRLWVTDGTAPRWPVDADNNTRIDGLAARVGTLEAGGGGGTTPDATSTVKGKLQLAGDLAGTAAAPTVPGLATKVAKDTLVYNVMDHGAVADYNGTTGTDNLAAFNATITAAPSGARVFVPAGRYYFSGPLELGSKTLDFDCAAGGFIDQIGTQLVFAAGSSGLKVTQPGATPPRGWRIGPFTITSKSTAAGSGVGIYVTQGPGLIDHATVESFGSHGVHVKAGVGFGGGNANNSILNRVRANANRGDGIKLEGSDANACLVIKPDVVANYGYGVNLESAAMCKVIAPHADQQYNSSPGAYRDNGNSNDWDWVYSEGSVTFFIDTGASSGRLRASAYGVPTLTTSGSGWTSFDIKLQAGQVYSRQEIQEAAGGKLWRTMAGSFGAGSYDLIQQTNSLRVWTIDSGVTRIQFYAALRPSATNTLDLGSSSVKWRDLYLAGLLHLPSYTTAGRPSATTAGAGALIFDTDLNSALYSNGTTWLDPGTTAAGALQKSIATTKGDLFVATASGVVARHGVGTDGYALVADSTQTDGVAWAPRSPDIQTFTASGTWTMPTGAKTVRVQGIGPGGGGGSGRRGAAGTVRCGGGGGGGGGYVDFVFLASELISSVTVTVGAGGTAGAAVTADDTSGNAGGTGGAHTFGSYLRAGGGGGGSGGTASAGAGGSGRVGLTNGTTGASASTTGGVGQGPTSTIIPGGAGAGGNSGGGITSANVANNGGSTSATNSINPANTAAAGVVDTTSPENGASVAAGMPMTGTAGGGGAASITQAAQAGGTAGNYGVGGSGGGASLNGNNSGAGSAGAPGIWRVTTSF